MIAIYLGARTLIVGRSGVTVHRHTRGTINPDMAVFGFRWQRRQS